MDMTRPISEFNFYLEPRDPEPAHVPEWDDPPAPFELLTDVAPTPEERVADEELRVRARQEVWSALAALTEVERQVLRRRMLSEDPPSLADLAWEMDISEARVREIEASAMSKVRAYFTEGPWARELVA